MATRTNTSGRFYSVAPEVREALSCQEVACPGHPNRFANAVVVTFPEGTKLVSQPTAELRFSMYRWELPNGDTVSADCQILHAYLND